MTTTIAFLLFPNVTQLDLAGPAQVLARLGDATLDLVWTTLDPVPTDAGFAIVPTATFADVPAADILCVPGGLGVNGVIADDEAMAWVRQVGGRADWVTSVCTGSLILGAAGLLDGYRATSHWCVRESVLPLLGAIPVDERVVFDRDRVTAAGISAGLDFALALAARLRGEDYARTAQLVAEYAPQPPFATGSPARAGPGTTRAALAILGDLVAEARAAAMGRAR